MKMSDVPGLMDADAVEALRRAARFSGGNVKPIPAILRKADEKKAKKKTDDEFRAEIWKRDGGKSRATGFPLVRGGTTDPHKLGEVDHSIPRSLAPDRIYDLGNALLLSKWENRARKVPCPRAPEFRLFDYAGPDDRRQLQRFVWRNADGKVIRETVG